MFTTGSYLCVAQLYKLAIQVSYPFPCPMFYHFESCPVNTSARQQILGKMGFCDEKYCLVYNSLTRLSGSCSHFLLAFKAVFAQMHLCFQSLKQFEISLCDCQLWKLTKKMVLFKNLILKWNLECQEYFINDTMPCTIIYLHGYYYTLLPSYPSQCCKDKCFSTRVYSIFSLQAYLI